MHGYGQKLCPLLEKRQDNLCHLQERFLHQGWGKALRRWTPTTFIVSFTNSEKRRAGYKPWLLAPSAQPLWPWTVSDGVYEPSIVRCHYNTVQHDKLSNIAIQWPKKYMDQTLKSEKTRHMLFLLWYSHKTQHVGSMSNRCRSQRLCYIQALFNSHILNHSTKLANESLLYSTQFSTFSPNCYKVLKYFMKCF